jgi:hypothetical protein
VFGDVTRSAVQAWLDEHLRRRLSARLDAVTFHAGRVSAVYGLRLLDGRELVAKVHRRPVNVARLAAAVVCQRQLAAAGYPCPLPVDGPAVTAGRVAVLESLLDAGTPGNAHEPDPAGDGPVPG